MNDYLLVLRPVRLEMLAEATDEESRAVGEHFVRLKNAFEAGTVSFVGRTLTTGPETVGLAVFSAASQEEAEAWAAQDPCVLQGVMTAEVMPFRVVLGGGR